MKKKTGECSIWFDAPREQVWQAVTDPEQLAQWLLPPLLGAQMKRDENSQVFMCMGGMVLENLQAFIAGESLPYPQGF